MTTKAHWENVYRTKAVDEVSWYRPHLEVSLSLIEHATPDTGSAVIDVGGGEATLVDDLVARGYSDVTVLDISQAAIDVAKGRLGPSSCSVHWITGDITAVELEAARYDVWHDRAVFHFLTSAGDRAAYVRQVAHAVRLGGHVIVGTFGLDGPEKCADWRSFATTQETCMASSGQSSVYWTVSPRCTRRLGGRLSSSFIASVG